MKIETLKRKEVELTEGVIKALAKLAAADKRSLKNYMEIVLASHIEQVRTVKTDSK
jgi:hypothetical protein